MNTNCWRCGRVLEHGTECDPSCVNVTITQAQPQIQAVAQLVFIDWNKVENFEQLKRVLAEFNFNTVKGSAAYERLKRFLKSD